MVAVRNGEAGIALPLDCYHFVAMRAITCKIPEKLDEEIEAIAEKRGISKSELVREAIEHNLERQKKKVKLSAYDVMKEACGIIKGGPRDLATNPKHMKRFGRD